MDCVCSKYDLMADFCEHGDEFLSTVTTQGILYYEYK
jgi:hypothetical protein